MRKIENAEYAVITYTTRVNVYATTKSMWLKWDGFAFYDPD